MCLLLFLVWNSIVIARFAYLSTDLEIDGIRLSPNVICTSSQAEKIPRIASLFDETRFVVDKLRELNVDEVEMGCVYAILLFSGKNENIFTTYILLMHPEFCVSKVLFFIPMLSA